jgi:Peptidase A4 family
MTDGPSERLKATRKTLEELGVRLYTPAPEAFDPVAASAAELQLYGYPERPDAQLHPALYERWQRVVSRSVIVEPQFGEVPAANAPPWGQIPQFPTWGVSANWSGAVAFAEPGDGVTSVSGLWTVPDLNTDFDVGVAKICATWIGIDGWQAGTEPIPVGLVQAGTTRLATKKVVTAQWPDGQELDEGAVFSFTYPWWEWVPEDPVAITNLQVSPGDVMFCTITARSPFEAAFFMSNTTTALTVSFVKTAPPDTRIEGYCADWILEAPTGTVDGLPLELGDFATVYFDFCTARLGNRVTLPAGSGELLKMVSAGNHNLAVATAIGDTLIRIDC